MRCEGYRRYGGAFTFGPVIWRQCENEAMVMLEVKQKEEGVYKGPACGECWQEAIGNDKIEIISVEPIIAGGKK